jgi:hypothetical protein
VAEGDGLLNRCSLPATPDKQTTSESDDAALSRGLALLAEKSPDLAAIIDAWPALPADVRRTILHVVNATKNLIDKP